MNRDTILINNIYTGDYTKENIGHEIINLYKTDRDEHYIYISPYGYLTKNWNGRIKNIICTRNAGKDKVEIIAIAKIDKQEEELINKKLKQYPKLSLTNMEDNDKNAEKEEWKKQMRSTWDIEYINYIEKVKELEKEYRNNIKENPNNYDTDCLPPELANLLDEKNIPHEKYDETYKNWKNNKERKNEIETIENWENEYERWKKVYIEWLKDSLLVHFEQIKKIYKENITYNMIPLCEIFDDNEGDDHAIYFAYKPNCINFPKNDIKVYIKYDYNNTENTQDNKTPEYSHEEKTKNSNEEPTEITYYFKHIKFKNNSCLNYLNKEKIINFDKFEETLRTTFGINFCDDIKKFDDEEDDEDYQNNFIRIMGKQDDELAYSNMFAHYLNDKEIFKEFAQEVLLETITLNETFEIKREYGNIDLFIETDNAVFIIENKIKSGINGVKYDPYTGEYSNQLIKYYDDTINKFDNKHKHYYIFKPDYNAISIEKLTEAIKEEEKEKKEEKKEKINKYKIINYSKIYNFFNKQQNIKQDFINALSLHTKEYNNVIETEMAYKFRQKINNAKIRNKKTSNQ